MRDPLDAGLAATLQNVKDLLGAAVNMAERGIGIERQPICHDVLGSEVTIDQPLQRSALHGKAADLTVMAEARPLLHGHSGTRMITMARTLTISTKGMEYRAFGRTGMKVSVLGLGCGGFGGVRLAPAAVGKGGGQGAGRG